MNRTLLERARCMLLNAKLQKQYWAETISTAAYITNRCPCRALAFQTPEEIWTSEKPNIKHLKIFGCEAMVHIPKEKIKKSDSKATKMIFLGYCEYTKGYKFFDTKTKKATVSRDAIFLESTVKRNYAKLPLSEFTTEADTLKNESINSEQVTASDLSEQNVTSDQSFHSDTGSIYEPEESIDLKEISRNVTTRSRSRMNKEGNTYICTDNVLDQQDIPETYSEAISNNVNAVKWKQSIKDELLAHEVNKTWQLVEKPPGVWTIGCKWVFRVKDLPSGPLYKSRLCAKGCAQTQGINYSETFSPTVRYDSIRVLLSEAAEHNLEMVQFDVKTAFLYGDIKEDIYMTPPEG